METGEPLLLRLEPDAGEDEPALDGAVVSHNPCLSGGALDIFLDPCLPPPRVVVVGDAPVARALRDLAPHAGLEAAATAGAEDFALVVASHGRDEEPALAAALTSGVPYVGLVASRRRGEAVRAALDVPDALRARLHTPAGLDIGARTAPEIALAILAEIVQERRSGTPRATPVRVAEPGGGATCCHGHGEH
jgi:xanthine dehydrogenase accessory factor